MCRCQGKQQAASLAMQAGELARYGALTEGSEIETSA